MQSFLITHTKMSSQLYELFEGANPVIEPRPQAELEAIVARRCNSYDAAEFYVKELESDISSCEFQLAAPFGYFRVVADRAAAIKKLAHAKELLPLATAARDKQRLVRIGELKDKVDEREREIHDHIRQIESRVVMSKKEEIAREATVEWLQEEVDKLEDKIHALEHIVADPECPTCTEMRKAAERHEAFQAAREADGVADDYDSDY